MVRLDAERSAVGGVPVKPVMFDELAAVTAGMPPAGLANASRETRGGTSVGVAAHGGSVVCRRKTPSEWAMLLEL